MTLTDILDAMNADSLPALRARLQAGETLTLPPHCTDADGVSVNLRVHEAVLLGAPFTQHLRLMVAAMLAGRQYWQDPDYIAQTEADAAIARALLGV